MAQPVRPTDHPSPAYHASHEAQRPHSRITCANVVRHMRYNRADDHPCGVWISQIASFPGETFAFLNEGTGPQGGRLAPPDGLSRRRMMLRPSRCRALRNTSPGPPRQNIEVPPGVRKAVRQTALKSAYPDCRRQLQREGTQAPVLDFSILDLLQARPDELLDVKAVTFMDCVDGRTRFARSPEPPLRTGEFTRLDVSR
jgi:hypothetical protein